MIECGAYVLKIKTIEGYAYKISDDIAFDRKSTAELRKIVPFQNELLNDPVIAPLEMTTHTASRGRSIWLYVTNPTHLLIRNDALLIDSFGLVLYITIPTTTLRLIKMEVLPDAVLTTNQMGQVSAAMKKTIGMESVSRLAWYGNFESDEVLRGSTRWTAEWMYWKNWKNGRKLVLGFLSNNWGLELCLIE